MALLTAQLRAHASAVENSTTTFPFGAGMVLPFLWFRHEVMCSALYPLARAHGSDKPISEASLLVRLAFGVTL